MHKLTAAVASYVVLNQV